MKNETENRHPRSSPLRSDLRCARLLPLATEGTQEVLIVAPETPITREEYEKKQN